MNIVSKRPLILLACGSYSPPTIMHLRMFELARDYFETNAEYTLVKGIISPVHDLYVKKELVASHHRINMLNAMIKDNSASDKEGRHDSSNGSSSLSSWIVVDDWEIKQKEWTRTARLLEHSMSTERAIRSAARVMVLCGADLLCSMNTPGLWDEKDIEYILSNGIAVVTREGSNIDQIISENPIINKHKNDIHQIVEWIPNQISSTLIRKAIKQKKSIKYFVDNSVEQYINLHKLYHE